MSNTGVGSGDYVTVEWDELEAATDVDKLDTKRFKAAEVFVMYNDKGDSRFPSVEG
jgi:hypothetical protein